MQGYSYQPNWAPMNNSYQPNWAPMNNNYGNPYTWQPTFSGTGSHVPGGPRMPQQQGTSNVIKVAGPESAKAFSVGPNAFVVLFDESRPIFYSKTTDDGGFPTIRVFKFDEMLPEPTTSQEVPAQTVPAKAEQDIEMLKDGFARMSADISDLKKMLEGLVS